MARPSYLVAGDLATDLAIARAMTAELEAYIVNDDLYRTITVRLADGDHNLQMTGSDLLSRLHRLQTDRSLLNATQQTELDAIQKQRAETIYSLRTRFHERLQREIKARLDSLRWFLDDCTQDNQRCRVEFPFEIRNRQRIEEACKELGADFSPDLQTSLQKVDERLRRMTAASSFIWDEKLKTAYPINPYWYLYVRP